MSTAPRLPFLFEIGTDELPARFLPVERKHVDAGCRACSRMRGWSTGDLRVLASPRRLRSASRGCRRVSPTARWN